MFLSILKLVLKIGNYLNAGTSRGNCPGYMINSLLILDTVKGKDKQTLLDFIIKNVKTKEPQLLYFYKDFLCLDEACDVSIND